MSLPKTVSRATNRREIDILPGKDENFSLVTWLLHKDSHLCWICRHYRDSRDECNSLHCLLSPSMVKTRGLWFWHKKNLDLYTFCKVLLGKLPFCAICNENRPTKKILYQCEHAEECDVFPETRQDAQPANLTCEIPVGIEKVFLEEKLKHL